MFTKYDPSLVETITGHYPVAIDTERGLEVHQSDGRSRNMPKWFVFRTQDPPGTRAGNRVIIREWTLDDAINRLNTDKRTITRINKLRRR